MDRIYVAIDLEFTGLDPARDDIIEIAMVKFRGHDVVDTFSSLVRPQRSIPLKTRQMVGITDGDVANAPTIKSLAGRIVAMAGSHPVVAHSVDMDLAFLKRHNLLLQNLPIDTFELAGIALPGSGHYSLEHIANLLDIDVSNHHRALPDAMATKDVFLAIVERIRAWDHGLLQEIAGLGSPADWPLARVFRDLVQDGQDAAPILEGPTRRPTGDSIGVQPDDRFDPLSPRDPPEPIDADELAEMVSPHGVFANTFAGYEYRPQQVEMVRAVAEAFNYATHLLVEAGTGTGKSVAYLLPAVRFAVQNEQRVIVSSNTINLQDQLFGKDIPDVRRALSLPFRAALLKGRSNYLCLRRLSLLRRNHQLGTEQIRGLAKILAWLPQTSTGDRVELVLVNADHDLWAQVAASSETCLGEMCPYRRSGQCFLYRARSRAERAHIVVVNHALLLSDLVMGNRLLPEYKYLIIDEAHHLESTATDQFGIQVSQRDGYAFLAGVSHETAGTPAGLVAHVPALLQKDQFPAAGRSTLTNTLETLQREVDNAQRRLHALFRTISAFVENHDNDQNPPSRSHNKTIRLTMGQRVQPAWSEVEIAWDDFAAPLQRVLDGLENLVRVIQGLEITDDPERDEILQEVQTSLQVGRELYTNLDQIVTATDDGSIYWIEVASRGNEITLQSAPLQVGPLLQDHLFSDKECVVLTSATLQTNNSFRYIRERLGLEDPAELALDSPFDFETAVLLYVPKDIPQPYEPYYQKTVEKAIIDLCQATQGRTMVLFTSNSQLHATYRAVRGPLERAGIVVFGQGFDGSRRQILDRFRTSPRAVLLGTRSFWEGVDIVGSALSCLVMTRLPFSVPTDPVFSARAETFEDPFNEYSLPDAILRFRQGFGRLIRSKDDYGIVVVLDRRLITKTYGKTLLRSLPGCTARMGPLATLPRLAERWLDPENRS